MSQLAEGIGIAEAPPSAARPAPSRRRRPALPWRRLLLPLVFVAVVLGLAQWLITALNVSPMLLVPPSAVWSQFVTAWPILLQQTVPTLINTVCGFLIAAVSGIGIGMALVASRRVEQAIWPHLLMFQLVPKVALAPLFIVWFGMGPTTRLAFGVFLAFFPITVSAAAGFRAADPAVLRLCQSLNASTFQVFRSVRLPYALPHIFAGLKVGVTVAMIGVIVAEFVTGQEGLGYIILYASSSVQTALAFTAILMLCVVGSLLYGAVALAEWLCGLRFAAPLSIGGF